MTNKKALVKGTIKISFIVAVLVALGFLVFNYVIPVLAAHTSTVDLSPSYPPENVPPNTNISFTLTITNTDGDPISEIRIYHDSVNIDNPNDFTSYACEPKTGWNGPYVISGSEGTYCLYVAQDDSNRIYPTESESFSFYAMSPYTSSCRNLHFESRDINYFWQPLYDNACVDTDSPMTTKKYGDPNKPVIFYLFDKIPVKADFITTTTTITLTPSDFPESHPSDVDTYYIVKVPCIWYDDPQYECDQPEWIGLLDQEIYYDYNSCATNNDEECEITWWNVKWELTNGWTLYEEPFVIPQESIHKICFYSVDELGNEEEIKCQIAIVDDTPPVTTKTIGDPKLTQDIEELGNGNSEWSTEEAYTGTYSAKLTTPSEAGGQDFAGVDSFFDVFVELDDITSLSYYKKVTQYDTNGWNPIVILGIDADNDGVFEADPLAWESTFDISYLGDDSFIQCEAIAGLSGTDSSFVYVDAYSDFKCYTPKTDGSGFYWDVYEPLSYYQENSVGIVNPTDDVTMIKVEIGGSGNFNDEIAYIDYVEFNGDIIIDEPLWWIGSNTPIYLSCTDPEPHPAGVDNIQYRYRVNDGAWTEWFVYPEDTIYFPEESRHELEYYCNDTVGNEETHHFQTYIVDATPPSIYKEMFGNYLLPENCPPQDYDDNTPCYVADNGQSGVKVTVTDGGEHAVGGVNCYYQIYWVEEEEIVEDGYFSDYKEIIFKEDSTHVLTIDCFDKLGNKMPTDEEEFLVDSTPPVTTKEYGEPFVEDYFPKGCNYDNNNCNGEGCNGNGYDNGYRCGWAEWINSSTPISLSAYDEKVDVEKTYWRNLRVLDGEAAYYICGFPEQYCNPQVYMDNVENPDEPWNEWTGEPFNKKEESCHVIEYRSVDKLGNEEDIRWQCVFVDNTAPEVSKEIGEPKVQGGEGVYYVSQETPITLSCQDIEPHPVDHVSLWYRYRISEDCEDWGEWTEWTDPNGNVVNFPEDSCHQLEYYCEDGLGNVGPTQTEIDIVDTQAPIIDVNVGEPKYGDFIDGKTEINVNAYDQEPHPVGDVLCDWWYYLDDSTTSTSGGSELTPPFVIVFKEDTKHELHIECTDALGNSAEYTKTFYVDKTEPTTTKTYGDPKYTDGTKKWITSQTPITLTVDDTGPHKSGIKETKYSVTPVDDSYCESQTACDGATGSGEWNTYYTTPFTISQQSCHLIEYYSVDNVDKTEKVNKQCVFVDNTSPTPDKKVGEPKAVWDGKDANFYPEIGDLCWNGQEDEIECWKTTLLTPIKLDCTDPDPHPVNNEKSCFKVEWDGDDQTETYCNNLEGDLTEDGFCCVSEEITFMFDKISEHELEYYCEDALGNSNKENLDIEKFKVEETSFNITINKKWNLISTPVALLDDSMKVIFGEESDTIEAVWAYDGETDQWYVYTPDGEDNDNLDTMIPGWGYWVKAWKDDTLVIGGSLMSPGKTPPSRSIVEGWNLIGYYGANGMTEYNGPWGNGNQANCALNSLGEDVLDKEFTSLWTYWEPDNPDTWKPLGEWDYMDPGAGYWLATPQNGLYTPSTTCGWW